MEPKQTNDEEWTLMEIGSVKNMKRNAENGNTIAKRMKTFESVATVSSIFASSSDSSRQKNENVEEMNLTIDDMPNEVRNC